MSSALIAAAQGNPQTFSGSNGGQYLVYNGQYYPVNAASQGVGTPLSSDQAAQIGLPAVGSGASSSNPMASPYSTGPIQGGPSSSIQNSQALSSALNPSAPVANISGYQQYLQAPGTNQQSFGSNTALGQSVIPQINTSNVAQTAANPLQPTYVSAPTAQSTQFEGAQLGNINPAVLQAFSPDAAVQQLYNEFQPAASQASRQLNDQLASMGLVGGPALQAQTNLQQQLSAGLGNSLAGVIQNSQGNQLNALENQAGLQQQTGLANQSASNQFTLQNLSDQFGANQYNATAANDANNAYSQALLAAYNNNLANFQNMNQAGYTGATNIAGAGQTGSQNLAGSFASNYPVQTGVSNAFSNLGTQIGYGQQQTQQNNSTNNAAYQAQQQAGAQGFSTIAGLINQDTGGES